MCRCNPFFFRADFLKRSKFVNKSGRMYAPSTATQWRALTKTSTYRVWTWKFQFGPENACRVNLFFVLFSFWSWCCDDILLSFAFVFFALSTCREPPMQNFLGDLLAIELWIINNAVLLSFVVLLRRRECVFACLSTLCSNNTCTTFATRLLKSSSPFNTSNFRFLKWKAACHAVSIAIAQQLVY